jgi:hypothetical protein
VIGVALMLATPALPLGKAGRYVAAAYVVLFALILVYVAIMAIRLSRMDRDLAELVELAERGGGAREEGAPSAGDTTASASP